MTAPRTPRRIGRTVLAFVLVAAVAAGAWYVFARTDRTTTVRVDFAYVNGLYAGSNVTVLGVPVGTVEKVEPMGTFVRVTASVPASVELPADVHAYVLNPSVISDRHLEFGPAYQGGPRLQDGDVVPLDRSHAPIDFDGLMGSLATLAEALGPEGGNAGDLLSRAASGLQGRGDDFNRAVRDLGAATGVVGARSEDIGAVVENLNTLMAQLDDRQVSLDALVSDLAALGDEWSTRDLDLSEPLQDLATVFDQIDRFTAEHGDDVGAVAQNLSALGGTLVANRSGLAEFMDLVPLLMQNLSQTVGPDDRGRIRLNVSTALTQFAVAQPLCEQYPMPLCTGAGFTNPISFPISASDPLGLATLLSGGMARPEELMRRAAVVVGGALVGAVLVAGCGAGIQDLPLGRSVPGDTYTVHVQLADADGLLTGADVRNGQRVVGRVSDLSTDTVGAIVDLNLSSSVALPENVEVAVELPSALGSPFIRLRAPEQPSTEMLADGDVIAESRTEVGPQIESALAALGTILTGSGFDQLQTVLDELNVAFAGRPRQVRDLLGTVTTLTGLRCHIGRSSTPRWSWLRTSHADSRPSSRRSTSSSTSRRGDERACGAAGANLDSARLECGAGRSPRLRAVTGVDGAGRDARRHCHGVWRR